MILPGINSFLQGVEKTMGPRNNREGPDLLAESCRTHSLGYTVLYRQELLDAPSPIDYSGGDCSWRRNTQRPCGLGLAGGMGVNIASALVKYFLLIEIHTQERLLCIVEGKMGNYLMMG